MLITTSYLDLMDDHAICGLRNNWFRRMKRMPLAFLLSVMLRWYVTRTIRSFAKPISQKGHNSSQQRVVNVRDHTSSSLSSYILIKDIDAV